MLCFHFFYKGTCISRENESEGGDVCVCIRVHTVYLSKGGQKVKS